MVVQVVLGEVGEGGHRKAGAQDAAQVDGVARHLERRHAHTGFGHVCQQHLQVAAFGRGVQRGAHLGAHMALHSAHEARLLAGHGGHVLHEEGGGGLAVGAGHTHQAQLLAGLAVKARAAQGQGLAGVVNEELRHVERQRALNHQGRRAALHCVCSVVVAVCRGTGHAEEERAGLDPARGELDCAHLQAGVRALEGLDVHVLQYLRDTHLLVHTVSPLHCVVKKLKRPA